MDDTRLTRKRMLLLFQESILIVGTNAVKSKVFHSRTFLEIIPEIVFRLVGDEVYGEGLKHL